MDDNKELMAVKIAHENYEKITDDLLWLSKNWMLKFVVQLNRTTNRFGKVNYHKEVGYYKDNKYCVNINRSFDYYLLFESSKDSRGEKESIMIRNTDIYLFKYKLQLVYDWFTAEKHQGLFAKKDGKIIMTSRVEPIKMVNLPLNKYIDFDTSIYQSANGKDQLIGVRMYMNNDNKSFFMEINRFLGFKYFIDTFNMHECALLMINYLQRPMYGTNMFNISNKQTNQSKFIS